MSDTPRTPSGRKLLDEMLRFGAPVGLHETIIAIEAESALRGAGDTPAQEPLSEALEAGAEIIADLTAWAESIGGWPQTLADRASWWLLDVDPARGAAQRMSGCFVPTTLLRTEWPLVAGQEQGYPFAELLASIAAEGIREPITIKLDWSVIDGAHRLAAARQLGIESVPVRIWTGTEWLPRVGVPVEPRPPETQPPWKRHDPAECRTCGDIQMRDEGTDRLLLHWGQIMEADEELLAALTAGALAERLRQCYSADMPLHETWTQDAAGILGDLGVPVEPPATPEPPRE